MAQISLMSSISFMEVKKKLPNCVSGHLESLKTHLFLGENGYFVF